MQISRCIIFHILALIVIGVLQCGSYTEVSCTVVRYGHECARKNVRAEKGDERRHAEGPGEKPGDLQGQGESLYASLQGHMKRMTALISCIFKSARANRCR